MRNPLAVVFSALFLVFTLFTPALYAEQHGCTTANIKGTYGYEGFGTVLAGNPLLSPAGTYSSVGTLTFDGKGNLLIADTGRVDNTFTPDPPTTEKTYEATYTVTKQCIVTFTITAWANAGLAGPHWKVVFVENRNKGLGMSLIPGIIVNYVNTTKIATDNQQ